jgi:hypothetical protein
MPEHIQKKTRTRARHRRVALEFSEWLSEHPNATLKKKVNKLDQMTDYAYLKDTKNH